jgi:cytochrome c553
VKDTASAQAGLAIEQHGVPENGVPACGTCHALAPQANGPVYPYIDGQFADYIERQLENFRTGNRRSADAQIMVPIARGLSAEQSHAVAVHFASKTPPPSTTKMR